MNIHIHEYFLTIVNMLVFCKTLIMTRKSNAATTIPQFIKLIDKS